MRRIILTIFLLCPYLLLAQDLHIDLSRDGSLDLALWRHDTDAYTVHSGWLSLNAPPNRAGRKLITTNTILTGQTLWQGVVQLSDMPTVKNCVYVLLACYAEHPRDGVYDYLALSIGGGRRGTIALVVMRLHTRSSTPWKIAQETILLDTDLMPEALLRQGLRYRIGYQSSSKLLTLRLSEVKRTEEHELFAQSTHWQATLPAKNTFGLLCLYSPKRYDGCRFSELSVSAAELPPAPAPKVPKPSPDLPNPPDSEEVKAVCLSEIMANPLAGCPEYIELYNPDDREQSLEGYALLLHSTSGRPKQYLLPAISIKSKGFLVLSTAPELLARTYTNVPKETLVRYKLPQLANTGFRLSLIYDGDLVDDVLYDTGLFPKGLKTKKGVALERSSLELDAPWQPVSARVGYASPGVGPVTLGLDKDIQTRDGSSSLSELLLRWEREPHLRLVCIVVDFSGHTLLRMEGRKVYNALQVFSTHGIPFPFSELSVGKAGIISVMLEEPKSSEVVDHWGLKFLRK